MFLVAYHPKRTLTPRYLFDLDGWQIRNPPAGLRLVDSRLADIAEASADRASTAEREVDDPSFVYNAFSGKPESSSFGI